MLHTRRNLLVGLGSLLAAPAIVRASSLMPVRRIPLAAAPYAMWLTVWTHTAQFGVGDSIEIAGEHWTVLRLNGMEFTAVPSRSDPPA